MRSDRSLEGTIEETDLPFRKANCMAACSLYEQTNFAEPFHLIDSVGGSSTSRIEWQAQFLLVLRPTFFS